MCASTTVASLKFPLQDPLHNSGNNHTTIISSKLICFNKQIDLFIQHLLEIIPSECHWVIKTDTHVDWIDELTKKLAVARRRFEVLRASPPWGLKN